jgi:hypothetical protein
MSLMLFNPRRPTFFISAIPPLYPRLWELRTQLPAQRASDSEGSLSEAVAFLETPVEEREAVIHNAVPVTLSE